MLYEFSRTELLIGKKNIDILKNSKVAIFGVGGVGSFAVEGLVRAGVGKVILVDDDCICLTNINRQIQATHATIGKPKVDVMRERILDINPNVKVTAVQSFYSEKNSDELISNDYDYIVDAIDTVTSKLDLIVKAKLMNIPIISCLGAGNKLDPTRFEIADIYDTSICPLAKVMRKELRKKNISDLKVVYSKEEPIKPVDSNDTDCDTGCICPKGATKRCTCTIRRQIPGSISFVPSVAGLIIASYVVKDLITFNGSMAEG